MTFINQKKKLQIYKFNKLILMVILLVLTIIFLILSIKFDGYLENLFLNIFGGLLTGFIITTWSIVNEYFKLKIREKYIALKNQIDELTIPETDIDLKSIQELEYDTDENDTIDENVYKGKYCTDIYDKFMQKQHEYEKFCVDLRTLINDGSADEIVCTLEALICKTYGYLKQYHIDMYRYIPESQIINAMFSDNYDEERGYSTDYAMLLFSENGVVLGDAYNVIMHNISDFIIETNKLSKHLEEIKKNKLNEIKRFEPLI